jgi:EmrB/QacA subfamily drug resistance transporter
MDGAEASVTSSQGMTGQDAAHSRVRWWVLLAVGVGTFMSALDGSIINTILPVLTRVLHSNIATIEWVVTVYLLVISGLLLSMGRWSDLRGQKVVYQAGFVLFIVGSALCGTSSSALWLILFRGLQGVGAAMLFASSPAILTRNFPPEQRGQALGLQATMTYLGLTVGPPLGGWLTYAFSWRAVFYINVPVGLLALGLSWYFIPKDTGSKRERRFDFVGAAGFLIGLVALLLALDQGHAWGWTSPLTLGMVGFAVVTLIGFVLWEARVPAPMLDLSLFRRRLFSASVISALLNYVSIFSTVFLLPFYLIQGRHLSPAHTGLILTAQPLPMAAAAPISGWLSDKIGTRLPATVGMVILAVGLFLLSHLTSQTPLFMVMLSLAIAGLGTGIFIAPNNSALMGAAPAGRQGIAAGVLAMARTVGQVMGVGLAGAIFTSIQAHSSGVSGLFVGVHLGFLTASAVALAGALVSAVRGK